MFTKVINNEIIKKGLSVFAIKVTTAGLSFGVFVLLARWLSSEDYGFYATCFNLGTFFSLLALLGIHMLVLRQLPIHNSNCNTKDAVTLIRDGYIVIFKITSVLCILTMLAGLLGKVMGISFWAPLIAVFLALPLALSEYQCNILRGWGVFNLAIIPRDITWRILVLLVTGWIFIRYERLKVLEALVGTSGILIILVGIQFKIGYQTSPLGDIKASLRNVQPRPLKVLQQSRWFACASIFGAILPLLSVVGVGFMLDHEAGGVFFAAQRTSMLLSLPLIAANIICAPIIANAWATGEKSRVQNICTNIVISLIIPTAIGILIFIYKGEWLMSLFNPDYAEYKTILIVLSIGALINALCGPTGFLLQMTKQEKAFVVILLLTQSTGLVMVMIGALSYGLLGAAIADAFGLALWNVCAAIWAHKALGVDPTILSFVRKPIN